MGRSAAQSRSSSPPKKGEFDYLIQQNSRSGSRRGSRVSRQRSYDEEKNAESAGSAGKELGLGITNPAPRRYDILTNSKQYFVFDLIRNILN